MRNDDDKGVFVIAYIFMAISGGVVGFLFGLLF